MPDLDLSTIDETQEHYGDAPKINREESVLDSDTNQVAMGVPVHSATVRQLRRIR